MWRPQLKRPSASKCPYGNEGAQSDWEGIGERYLLEVVETTRGARACGRLPSQYPEQQHRTEKTGNAAVDRDHTGRADDSANHGERARHPLPRLFRRPMRSL